MNADGSGVTNLTNHSSGDGAPAWSPDGAKIAFTSVRSGNFGDIYVVNVDGSGVTNLTNHSSGGYHPAWSPDGAKIAFTSVRSGNLGDSSHNFGDIYVVNVDGSGVTNLTNHSSSNYHPAWSPDGTKIAFQSDRDGNPEIYVVTVPQ